MKHRPATIAEIDGRWWNATAAPWGVEHLILSPDGAILNRALCGFQPRHGWFTYQQTPLGDAADCRRCLNRACRRDERDEVDIDAEVAVGGE